MTAQRSADDRAWSQVERERRLDRILRRVTLGAWIVTVLLLLAFGVIVGLQVVELTRGALAGALPWSVVVGSAFPFIIVLGMLSVLIATLGTIAVFLRLRTASLQEIQLRLAALEEMLASRGDDADPRR